jgi:hypothetical protein
MDLPVASQAGQRTHTLPAESPLLRNATDRFGPACAACPADAHDARFSRCSMDGERQPLPGFDGGQA